MSNFTNFRAVYDELTDEVTRSRHQFFEEHLANWFAHLSSTPGIAEEVVRLEGGQNVQDFLKMAHETMGSFVGSGRLEWPKDLDRRLGMKLLVFREMAEDRLDATEFSYDFTYSENNFDVNIRELSNQVFSPMARELRRHLERLYATGQLKPNGVPASDRVVQIDHNSPAYANANDALAELEDAVAGTNQYDAPEEKERHVAEISAARRLLQSATVRVTAITALVAPVVTYISRKFFETGLSKVAGKVIDALVALIGALF